MAGSGKEEEKLTTAQNRAIVALLANRSVEAAAKKAGVGARTLYRWLAEDESFKVRLRATEGHLIDNAVRRLLGLNERAIETISDILNDEEESTSIRLRAATTALETTLKLRELRNVEERLNEIERILAGRDWREDDKE